MSRKRSPPPSTRQPRPARSLSVTATVRLDDATLTRIDAIVAERSTEWRKVTRAEVLREVIDNGLRLLERRRRRAAR